jgi:hypothetical protein
MTQSKGNTKKASYNQLVKMPFPSLKRLRPAENRRLRFSTESTFHKDDVYSLANQYLGNLFETAKAKR